MVKGCQKKTIHIKDPGSKYYEEAYFVLKPGVTESKVSDSDMINEAFRIAGESLFAADSGKKGRFSLKGAATFVAGSAAGIIAAAIVFVVILL